MDNAVALLKLLRGKNNGSQSKDGALEKEGGIRIVKNVTTDPNPATFIFEGSSLALDKVLFEIPVSLYPVCKGDRFLASPLIGDSANRWGCMSRINRGYTVGVMTEYNECQVEGIGRPYKSNELMIPSGIDKGDTVILLPYEQGGTIKYAIRKGEDKLRIIKVTAADPSPTAFIFESTGEPLDTSLVEMPVTLYPFCMGDRYLTSPLIEYGTKRWGITSRINRGYTKGTMITATQCQVEGIGRPYDSADLILPSLIPADGAVRPLKAGDVVSLLPVEDGSKIKYMATYCF